MNIDSLSLDDVDKIDPIAPDRIVLLSEVVSELPTKIPRYPTSWVELDKALGGGFKDGDLVIISGVSGEGKTTLSQTITYNLCLFNIPVCWFSYEVSNAHLDNKFREMGIKDFYKVYVPKKNTTGKLDWVKQKIIEAAVKFEAQVFIIDHIDFLSPMDAKTSDNEAIALKKIATELKSLATELGVVIICMAHIRKLPDGKKEPDMHDIGYSAGIFQLADYVLLVWREKIDAKKSLASGSVGEVATNNTFIKIVKNRETGVLKILKVYYENGKFNTYDWTPPIPDETSANQSGFIPE